MSTMNRHSRFEAFENGDDERGRFGVPVEARAYNQSKSKGKVEYFPGQKEQAGRIFAPGGIFERVLGGQPIAGEERQQQAGLQLMDRQFANRGLTGSGLESRATVDFLQESNQAIQDQQFQRILQLITPAGQQSSSSSWGLGS